MPVCYTQGQSCQRRGNNAGDTDFVARLHRNIALLGGQLKTRFKKPCCWHLRLLCLHAFAGDSIFMVVRQQLLRTLRAANCSNGGGERSALKVRLRLHRSTLAGPWSDWNYDVYSPGRLRVQPDKTLSCCIYAAWTVWQSSQLLERLIRPRLTQPFKTAGQELSCLLCRLL